MQLFSEDYLMHYGVKGMKWKQHKFGLGDGRPEDVNKGTEPGHFGLEKSDEWSRYKNPPTQDDIEVMRNRRLRIERDGRIKKAKKNKAKHYREDVGRSLSRAKRSRGFSATDERKGDANYLHVTRDDVGGSRHLKYTRRKDGRLAPYR